MAKYKVVLRDEQSPWQPGCPILVETVQVSRNTVTSEAYLQLRLRNVSGGEVGKIGLGIEALGPNGEHQELFPDFLDADVLPGGECIPKAIPLGFGDVEAVRVAVRASDGESGWGDPQPLSEPSRTELSAKAVGERNAQMSEDGVDASLDRFAHEDHGGWYRCSCGAPNVGRGSCWRCGARYGRLAHWDSPEELERAADDRVFERAERAESQETVKSMAMAIEDFESLGSYRDADKRAEALRERLDTAKALRDADNRKRKRAWAIAGIAVAVIAAIAVAAILFVDKVLVPAQRQAELESGADARVAALDCSLTPGDYVKLGFYEQDGDASNGKEEIEWRVLSIDGGKALLVSRYGLDSVPFNETASDGNDWDGCSLKAWLEGDFLDASFTEKEAGAISGSPFCLSADEAKRYFKDDDKYGYSKDRVCSPTSYAVAQGVEKESGYSTDPNNCKWWLRDSADEPYTAQIVDRSGRLGQHGVSNPSVAVRPAIWVDLQGDAPASASAASPDAAASPDIAGRYYLYSNASYSWKKGDGATNPLTIGEDGTVACEFLGGLGTWKKNEDKAFTDADGKVPDYVFAIGDRVICVQMQGGGNGYKALTCTLKEGSSIAVFMEAAFFE